MLSEWIPEGRREEDGAQGIASVRIGPNFAQDYAVCRAQTMSNDLKTEMSQLKALPQTHT